MRLLSAAAVWGTATALALWFAWQTKVGPVLVVVNSRHGIHLGDVLAFVVAYAWAGVATMALLLPPSRR
jgi:hypothetical protein